GTDSVAIGSGAVATNANDVALGANSVTSATTSVSSATINGVSYSFAGSTPTAALSVGGRQIQNVAAGQLNSNSTDAVNGSQLYATNQAIDALTTDVGTVSSNAVQYDSSDKGTVTLGGTTSTDGGATNGTTITNLHQGALNSTSTDAVNGSQLYATNENVANNTAEIASNTSDIANNTTNIANLSNGTEGLVQQAGGSSATNANAITVGAETGGSSVVFNNYDGDTRTLTGVSAGALNSSSTDAVNGSQLYATNQNVTNNTSDIANNTASISTLGTTTGNLGNSVAATLGGNASYDSSTGTISGFSQSLNNVDTTGAVGSASTVTTVSDALTALNSSIDNTANIAVKYDTAGGNTITLGATGGTLATGAS
ncbi:beta strand repeat-containing protein, partial [Frateuria aurantia]